MHRRAAELVLLMKQQPKNTAQPCLQLPHLSHGVEQGAEKQLPNVQQRSSNYKFAGMHTQYPGQWQMLQIVQSMQKSPTGITIHHPLLFCRLPS